MASVYVTVGGVRLTELIATTWPAQHAVGRLRDRVADVATDILTVHRKSGDAKITVTDGDVDKFVWLDDTDTSSDNSVNALAIEFGTMRSAAVAPLATAVGQVKRRGGR